MAIGQNECYARECMGTVERVAPKADSGRCQDQKAVRRTSLQQRRRVIRHKIFGFTFFPVVLPSQKQPFLLLELFLHMNSIKLCGLGM